MYFLLWTKGSHQSPNFDTFKHSGENLLNSSCYFPNHKSIFVQILHDSSVSWWKIIPLYFFRSNSIYFAQKEQSTSKVLRFLSTGIKIYQILVVFETTNYSVMVHNSSVLFYLKFYILSTKGAYESTHLVKFHVSSQKVWDFALLFSKSYKVFC